MPEAYKKREIDREKKNREEEEEEGWGRKMTPTKVIKGG